MKKIIPKGSGLIPDAAKCVFKGEIFDVYQWQQKLYDGSFATFERLKRDDTVSVFAIVDDKIIVLEDEQPDRNMVLALPGGRVDDTDPSILAAAMRETYEETGYRFEQWRLIEVRAPVFKMEWFMYTYIAFGEYTIDKPHVDPGERIIVRLESFENVKELQRKGQERFVDHEALKKANSLQKFLETLEFKGVEVDR